jgi:hypothetical protein
MNNECWCGAPLSYDQARSEMPTIPILLIGCSTGYNLVDWGESHGVESFIVVYNECNLLIELKDFHILL